jgi:Ferritin-like domain
MPEALPPIHQIDTDGAVGEAADRLARDPELAQAAADGDTRSQVLRKAALGGGALMGGGALLALPSLAVGADTRSARQDRAILNFALTLEYLEAEFYAQAVRGGALSGAVLTFARTVGEHEAEHVTFLRQALGSAAVARPSFDFKGTTTDQARFVATAVTLEDTGVAAYLGQSYRLKRTSYIAAAASLLAVEARHSAWARSLAGRQPSEEAFATRATIRQVLAAVRATGFITG